MRVNNRFPKDSRGLCHLNIGIAGRHNHANTFLMQPIDQAIGLLASAKIQINERGVGEAFRNQAQSISCGRDGSDHVRTASSKKISQPLGDLPGILDHKSSHSGPPAIAPPLALGFKVPAAGCRLAFRTMLSHLWIRAFLRCVSPDLAVRPKGANHQWRRIPPRELSIDLEADERLGWVTGRVEAS